MWGVVYSYVVMELCDIGNMFNYLVMGLWWYSQVNYDGLMLGVLKFDGDIVLQFCCDVFKLFFDQYLVDGVVKVDIFLVLIYNIGENYWDCLLQWLCIVVQNRLFYLCVGGRLFFEVLQFGEVMYEVYVFDLVKLVLFVLCLVCFVDCDMWISWLVKDQWFVDGCFDVLIFISELLIELLCIGGVLQVNLQVVISGIDSDWVVKLIDVYFDQILFMLEMGGYELVVLMVIFCGCYCESFSMFQVIVVNQVFDYWFGLFIVNYVFQLGYWVMVQVQFSFFLLYDCNLQIFVLNIYLVKLGDYQKVIQQIWYVLQQVSFILLLVY